MTSHSALGALQSFVFAATSSSSSKTTSSSPVFLILLVLLFAVYFLWLRPKRNQMRAQQTQVNAPVVGDEVVTSGGLIGRVLRFEGDRAVVEVAPGQQLTFLRTAILRRIEPVVPESADDYGDFSAPVEDEHESRDEDSGTDEAPRRWWPGSSGGDTPPDDAGGTN